MLPWFDNLELGGKIEEMDCGKSFIQGWKSVFGFRSCSCPGVGLGGYCNGDCEFLVQCV